MSSGTFQTALVYKVPLRIGFQRLSFRIIFHEHTSFNFCDEESRAYRQIAALNGRDNVERLSLEATQTAVTSRCGSFL
jgi:hypothetical protein